MIKHFAFNSMGFLQIQSLAKSIRVLADMEDPIGYVSKRTEVRN